MSETQIGIYLYGWYNSAKWAGHHSKHTSISGYYASNDPDLINWQMDLVAKSGVDYVVFEMLPAGDCSFETSVEYFHQAIPYLKKTNKSKPSIKKNSIPLIFMHDAHPEVACRLNNIFKGKYF